MEQVNREEIERLRERVHEQGNAITAHQGQFLQVEAREQDIDSKLDAIHTSIKGQINDLKDDLKEDLRDFRSEADRNFLELKSRVDKTNGRVTELERKSARTDGGLAVMALGLPVITGLLVYVLIQLLSVHS